MLTARGAGLIDSDKVVAVKFEAEHQPTSSPQNKLSNATKYKFPPGQCARARAWKHKFEEAAARRWKNVAGS